MNKTYVQNLSIEMRDLISEILEGQASTSFFLPKRKTVLLGDPQGEHASGSVILNLVSFETLDHTDEEEVRVTTSADTCLVFRAPIKASAVFAVSLVQTDFLIGLGYLDRLTEYFFNHKSIDPILPESLKTYDPLFQKMAGTKADLRPLSEKPELRTDLRTDPRTEMNRALFKFQYSALYHSGQPLREEKVVRKRSIDLGHNPNNSNQMRKSI